MKAFLLSAGLGTRLKPLTDATPKCLIPIHGKPLMQWWMELFAANGVSEVLVNTHYLAEQVQEFIKQHNDSRKMPIVSEYYESELLGSGGTVAANRDFIGDDEDFLVCYADNLTDINLKVLIDFHKNHHGILSMALFHTNIPKQCGIVVVDKNNKITEFVEKPEYPKSNLANAGVYVANREIFDYLSGEHFIDFGKDVLPKLVGNMYGCEMSSFLIDIGTIDNLNRAKEEWHHDHL